MKKTSIILSLVLAWMGAQTTNAQLSNADQLSAIIGTTPASTMTPGSYYILQSRSTSEYIIDNEGKIETTATAPTNGDADADGVYEYLFTITNSGYIQSADGNNLPALTNTMISDGTVDQGGQLVKPRAAAANGYDVMAGTATGYVSLMCNSLYLNCDLVGASTTAATTDWQLIPVTLVDRSTSGIATITYVYKNGSTEWYREQFTMNVGDPFPDVYAQPAGVKYGTVPTGTITGSQTINIECSLTDAFPITHFTSSYANATADNAWVFLSLNKFHLRYVANQSYVTVNTSQTTRPANNTTNYAYQWAFVGNPFTGFKIVNRTAGSSYILTSAAPSTTNEGGDTYPIMMRESNINTETNNIYWKVADSAPGVFIARQGETTYMNNRNGKLSYWTATDGGSRFAIAPVNENLNINSSIDVSKSYRIKNAKTGASICATSVTNESTSTNYDVISMTETDEDDQSQQWLLVKNGTGYTLRNIATDTYFNTTTQVANGRTYFTSSDKGTTFYFNPEGKNFTILTSTSTATGDNEYIAIADNGACPTTWTTASAYSEWILEEFSVTEKSTAITNLANLVNGGYYRFVNVHSNKALAENSNNGLNASNISEESTSQVWQLTKSANKYTFKNLQTGNYIQTSNNTSVNRTYPTGATATSFTIASASTENAFYITEGTVANSGLNHNNAYNVIINWNYTTDTGSHWYIYQVDNVSELQQIANEYNAATSVTNTQLQTYFNDFACTTLKSTYASMTDADLRNAMRTMPSTIQDMAVAVKNRTWNTEDETANKFEKGFRIASYEAYSDCDVWQQITKVGPFAMLFNPTGITVTPGDIVYIFVGADAAANTRLECHIAEDTNRYSSQTVTLTKGVNVINASIDGEIFIDYTVTNSTVNCNTIPNITVHIEGGNATGMWDMHRGMTNNDWTWLSNNSFGAKFLHVKGESTVLNLKTSLVREATDPIRIMKAWDFVFDTEEKLVGLQKYRDTGCYKPLINSRYSYNGNPNWDGGHGTNHPGLVANSVFNADNLWNVGTGGGTMWVIEHEEGHAHQYPILMAGTTESTNNSIAQCVNYLWARQPGVNGRSSRGEGVEGLIERFNNGYSWIDLASMRQGADIWISNRWFFQLWLYFDVLGNYQPAGGNDGFSFVSALCDKLRQDPIQYTRSGTKPTSPISATQDYLKIAKYAAEVAQADLSEYFEVWGFWKTSPAIVKTTNESNPAQVDYPDENLWFLGDYGSYWYTTSEDDVNTIKTEMQQYEKKCTNIMFIDDRGGADDTMPTYNNAPATSFGLTGNVSHFEELVSSAYTMQVEDGIVTMTGGEGAVGFKIYDKDGNLLWISNTPTFRVSDEIAGMLTSDECDIAVAQGDGTDVELEAITVPTIRRVTILVDKAKYGSASKADIEAMVNKILEK